MNHTTKALAVAAFALAGAFFGTATQASAANFTVNFAVHDADPSQSMIRTTTPLPNGVTGLIDPASAISAGGYDPASGNAVYSLGLPGLNQSSQVSIAYAKASDGISSSCTFTLKVTHDSSVLPYLLHFVTTSASACPVPSDVRSSNGQFTSQTYILGWST